VQESHPDGTILVKFDHFEAAWFDFSSHFSDETMEVDARDLGLSMKCDSREEFCVGNQVENTLVMGNSFEKGVVQEVFFSNDGRTGDNSYGKNVYRIKFEERDTPQLFQNNWLRKR